VLSKTAILPADIVALSGSVYPDNWISPNLQLHVAAGGGERILKISLWNPDSSSLFHNNSITVVSGNAIATVDSIKMGQIVDLSISMSGSFDNSIELSVNRFLKSASHDLRDRAMILVAANWEG